MREKMPGINDAAIRFERLARGVPDFRNATVICTLDVAHLKNCCATMLGDQI